MSKSHHSRSKASSVEGKLSVFDRLGSKSNKNAPKKVYTDDLEKIARPRDDGPRHKNPDMKKAIHAKKIKEKHRKQHNVHGGTPESNDLDLDLEGADEKFLQQRRLQLQRELRLQLKREKSTGVKQPKKIIKKVVATSSSGSSTDSSSSSSSSSSSYEEKRNVPRKRKPSVSSGSDSPQAKRKKPTKPVVKPKLDVKKKQSSPRKIEVAKKIVVKKSASPSYERRPSPVKKKSPPRVKPRPPIPKPKPREPSPKRVKKSKERRITPPVRPARPRSPDRRHRHSPRARHGGLEKGGKILPVKSLAYAKEMKETIRRKTPDRVREDKEKERIKERRRRELKAREVERREREREAERLKREAERQKERDEALARSRERQRERERLERIDREKRIKDYDRKELEPRKVESKSDLPSLLDIKTEAPREPPRRGWEERRGRRADDGFEYRQGGREDLGPDERRRGYDGKWGGESSGRDASWREHYPSRRGNENRSPKDDSRLDDRSASDHGKRPTDRLEEPRVGESITAERKTELEEILSDISDDADDILNQEEPVVEPVDTTPAQLLPVALSQPSAEFFFDSRRPLLECLGDRLDFEEISDEELEEEAKMGRGIMDVLGADWASLMSQTCVKTRITETASSARRRWRADSIIARIGISGKLAGKEFSDKFINRIITESHDSENQSTQNSEIEKIKQEIKEEKNVDEKSEQLNFLHRLPAVHAMLKGLSDPSPIFRILNSNKHALSAKSDLSIRRVACGFAPRDSLQLTSIDDNLYESNLSLINSAAG